VTPVAPAKKRGKFDSKRFLSTIDGGRKIADFPKKQRIFVQGDSSDAGFYIQTGKVRLTVVSKSGSIAEQVSVEMDSAKLAILVERLCCALNDCKKAALPLTGQTNP
jgi:hypothetical protein